MATIDDGEKVSTRDRMLRVTVQLMRRQGYFGTGLKEILDLSEAPKGSFYFHFPRGKQQLGVEAMREGGLELGKVIERILAAHSAVGQAVKSFVKSAAALLQRSGFKDGCPIATVALETAAVDDELRAACSEGLERWRYTVCNRLVTAGMPEHKAARLATVVLAAVEGGLLLSRAQHSIEPLETIADELAELVDQAVASQAPIASRARRSTLGARNNAVL